MVFKLFEKTFYSYKISDLFINKVISENSHKTANFDWKKVEKLYGKQLGLCKGRGVSGGSVLNPIF